MNKIYIIYVESIIPLLLLFLHLVLKLVVNTIIIIISNQSLTFTKNNIRFYCHTSLRNVYIGVHRRKAHFVSHFT